MVHGGTEHAASFLPHGFCYLWSPALLSLHVASDGVIAVAYFSIPASLVYVLRHRADAPQLRIFLGLFGAFIVACGSTHIVDIISIWWPIYWISGIMKAVTAVLSIVTAIALIPVLPVVVRLPNPIVDQLTRLPNRTAFTNRLLEKVRQTRHAGSAAFAVLYVDLDGFKTVNDRFGHSAGDRVLREVALRLRESVYSDDFVARIGGDEFAILADHLKSDGAAEDIARRIVTALARPFSVAVGEASIGASVGIAMNPREHDVELLIADADAAMYRAKARGTGSIETAGPV